MRNSFPKKIFLVLFILVSISTIFLAGLILGYSSTFFYSGKYAVLKDRIRFVSKLTQSLLNGEYFNSVQSLLLKQHHALLVDDFFPGKSGITISTDKVQPGYLLISRLSSTRKQYVIELMDKVSGKVIHEWVPKYEDIYLTKDISFDEEDAQSVFNMQLSHPLLNKDGSIVFIAIGGRLVKVDKDSKIVWQNKHRFHHSINMDVNGNIWVASKIKNSLYKVHPLKSPRDSNYENMKAVFEEESITQISPDGKILKEISIPQIFLDSGLKALVVSSLTIKNSDDPTHINDIQPVYKDRNFAKMGDLLLSLRSLNLILLYRPSENKVIWYKIGPWIAQHDVDVINDDEISVLNNDRPFDPYDKSTRSTIVFYNFKTDQTYEPYNKSIEAADFYVWAEGVHRILPNGNVLLEETVKGRILELSKNAIEWEYVNRYDQNNLGRISWLRFIPLEDVDLTVFNN